ncbi:MAG: preprotein translocase subunit TatC [Deltaproteobacteria bacterium]|nr:preprotein translocase subunit TatC [Deltaproteobacteria bacterium]
MLLFLFQTQAKLINYDKPEQACSFKNGERKALEREKIIECLKNIRGSIIRLIISFSVLALISYFFWKSILGFIQKPLGIPLVYYSIPEAFLVTIKIALFTGIFFSAPFLFRELWGSLAPFFTKNSRRYTTLVVLSATILFYSGGLICYYILLPAGIKFLVSYETSQIKPAISVDSYISFFVTFIFGFALAFEMPLLMLLLGLAGVVNARMLSNYRRYAILIIIITSAIITPTPDLLNLGLMSLPIYALYELSIILVRIFGKERKL